MSKKTVLMIVGSFRKNSFNQTVADYIAKKLEEKVKNDKTYIYEADITQKQLHFELIPSFLNDVKRINNDIAKMQHKKLCRQFSR